MSKENAEKYISLLEKYLDDLHRFTAVPSSEIVDDEFRLHTTERAFQLVVDTAIDLNSFIIRGGKLQMPDDNYSTFTLLGKNGYLDYSFAEKIASTVGLRNAVVHRYEKMSIVRMIDDIKQVIPLYDKYLEDMKKTIRTLL